MQNNTIHNSGWQLEPPTSGQIQISNRALARYVCYQLAQIPLVRGLGAHAIAVTHPDAWQSIIITRYDFIQVAIAVTADDMTLPLIADVQTRLHQALSQWLGMTITVQLSVATVVAAPPTTT
jgi:predicted DNA repair protein MutK